MSPDQALSLARGLFMVTAMVAGPILLAALFAGVVIGIIQTVTQVNEASISFVGKLIAVVAVVLVLGPMLSAQAVAYTRKSFESLSEVVR